MIPHSTTHHSLPGLRTTLRRLAHQLDLPVEQRARLALAVTQVAAGELGAGRSVTLHASREADPQDGEEVLTVRLRTPLAPRPPSMQALRDLPLPAERLPGSAAVWRLPHPGPPLPARPGGTPATTELLEEELRAAVARADTLAEDHKRLKHELAETNSGVLALYVQLEERDEQLRRAHGQMLRELEDALRPSPVRVPGLEMAVHYEPAGTDAPTGGDLYDWFLLPDGRVHITLVDALGHGVTSTRSALNVTHAVRTLALEGHPLESIVARTDEILLPFDRDLMATVLLMRIDPASGAFSLANGSHPPALLVREDGSAEFREVRGRGIGYPLPGSEQLLYDELAPGDLLVLYTDGLTESRRDPREGEQRLLEAARAHRHLPIEKIPGAIAADMHTVILHPDDTVALTVRRTREDSA
ncbi:potassium-transporting ATPase subunit B [Streptomyces spiroverticillatus]|uniref:Potassium-transporting ATPase subunit B n=1 Tax=Streptomyces finlayi TaxID=67296 RepID=A0A918X7Q5_9ACTN|nr:PP2C family protein-serine/threonine phosphatase [Streptomyces finlayi]GHA42319.1 potassium-transporting ATPase subunit B [Streptomyces spiroverticillatus]GHD17060.1 potassium-transporting ATPase subunit B [Streptomyces finlayi]